jgi:hypothetical protein
LPANWQYVDDLVNIRTINMKSIAFVARQFGVVSPIGTFGPLDLLTPLVSVVSVGTSITFKVTCATGYGNVNDRVIQWYYGTLLPSGQNGAPTAGPSTTNAATSSFTFTPPPGSSYVFCTVTDTFTGSIASARASAGLSNTAVADEWAGIYTH